VKDKVVPVHARKAYNGSKVYVKLYSFLTSVPYGGGQHNTMLILTLGRKILVPTE
jgi:hypothetical protein